MFRVTKWKAANHDWSHLLAWFERLGIRAEVRKMAQFSAVFREGQEYRADVGQLEVARRS